MIRALENFTLLLYLGAPFALTAGAVAIGLHQDTGASAFASLAGEATVWQPAEPGSAGPALAELAGVAIEYGEPYLLEYANTFATTAEGWLPAGGVPAEMPVATVDAFVGLVVSIEGGWVFVSNQRSGDGLFSVATAIRADSVVRAVRLQEVGG